MEPSAEELEKLNAERRLALYVGLYVGGVNKLDETMTVLIGNLVYKEHARLGLAAGESYSSKVRMISTLWPRAWTGRDRFLNALRTVGAHRNKLAHWSPEPDWTKIVTSETEFEDGDLPYLLQSGRFDRRGLPLSMSFTPAAFWDWHLRQSMLYYVCDAMFFTLDLHGEAFPPFDLQQFLDGMVTSSIFTGWAKEPRWGADVRLTFGEPSVDNPW